MKRIDLLNMPAGKELNALVAEKVMGLNVVSMNHPCGFGPGWRYEASTFIPPGGSWYIDEYPVYLPEHGIYPPVDDEMEKGLKYCIVEPVPFYSTDIVDAWKIVEKLEEKGYVFHIYRYGNWDKPESKKVWQCFTGDPKYNLHPFANADTPPLAICRAALLNILELELE